MTAHLLQAYRGGHNGRPGWWIHIEYDEAVVEALKDAVPAYDRAWDEAEKRWWVALEAEAEALRVVPSLEAYRAQGSLL
jgi:hypothetical protein